MGVVIALVAGAGVGGLLTYFWVQRHNPDVNPDGPVTGASADDAETGVARRSIELLRRGLVVLDADNGVVLANGPACALGAVEAERVPADVLRVARRARHDRLPQIGEVALGAGNPVRVEARPMGVSGHIALFLDPVADPVVVAAEAPLAVSVREADGGTVTVSVTGQRHGSTLEDTRA